MMPDLSLPTCLICDSKRSVFRRSATVQDREMIWYECSRCSSFLLWAGNDQWIYQKVGREAKGHLLAQTLTTAELETMAKASTEKPLKPSEIEPEEDEPEWGARVNTERRRNASDYPRWAPKPDGGGFIGEKGLFVWHRDSKTFTSIPPIHAVRLLDYLKSEEDWKECAINVFETPALFRMGDPDWKPEDPRENLIRLTPSQTWELFDLLIEKEAELRQMAKEETEDKQRWWSRVFDIIMTAHERINRTAQTADAED